MPKYAAYFFSQKGAGARGADEQAASFTAESLQAARAIVDDLVQQKGGLFHRIDEAVLSDPANPSVEYSRWMRGLGWIDNPDLGTRT